MDNNPYQAPTPPVTPPQPQDQPVIPVQPEQPAAMAQPPQQPMPEPVAPTQPQPVMPAQPVPMAPAPAAFPVPTAPVGSAPGGTYSPRRGPGKGLIFGLIGGFLGLLLLVGGGLLVVFMLSVTKADYQAAYDAASDVRDAYSEMGSVYISSYSSETEISNGVDTMKKGREQFNAAYDKLSSLKAVKADSDVAASFKKLDTKKASFDIAIDAQFEAYDKILPALSSLSSSSSSSSSAKLREMRVALEGVTGLENQANKDFVDQAVAALKKLEDLAARIEAARSSGKYDSAAVNQFYDAYSEFSTATKDWDSNLKKLEDDGELSDEINNLGELITKKLNAK